MSTDFRALCAELLDELVFRPVLLDRDLIERARAELAKPGCVEVLDPGALPLPAPQGGEVQP